MRSSLNVLVLVLLLLLLLLCDAIAQCEDHSERYYTFDGTCNNIANPTWGAAQSPFMRAFVTATSYTDGMGEMEDRAPENERPRPSIRVISNEMNKAAFSGLTLSEKLVNEFHTYWGQFIAIETCSTSRAPPSIANRASVSYAVPANDQYNGMVGEFEPVYGFGPPGTGPTSYSTETMSQSESNRHPDTMIGDIPRSPMNDQTPYLDLSNVYPADEETLNKLKLRRGSEEVWDNGKLDGTSMSEGSETPDFLFGAPNPAHFDTVGDSRINKTPGLLALFKLFIKEHNYQCDQALAGEGFFAGREPIVNAQELFDEARRVTIAIYQAISTREYLASTIGGPLTPYTDANTLEKSYDEDLMMGLDLSFGVCAFRYGHSSVRSFFPTLGPGNVPTEEGATMMRDTLFHPEDWFQRAKEGDNPHLTEFNSGCQFRGLSASLSAKVDTGFIEDVRNHMFGSRRGGVDLYSTNIFRGRDVGLPGYNQFRVDLGLTPYTSWSQITSNVRVQYFLNEVYNSTELQAVRAAIAANSTDPNFIPSAIDYCDPYVCGLAEDSNGSAIVGETFQAVLKEQFLVFRNADRLWYENVFEESEIEYIYARKLKTLIVQHFEVAEADLPTSPFYVDARQLSNGSGVDSFFWPDPEERIAALGLGLTSLEVSPANYRLSWVLNESQTSITFVIQSRGSGWIGLGFDPRPNTMKGADIIFCANDESGGGCTDRYAADVGIPTPDVDLGGSNDISDVFFHQADGFTTAIFTRPTTATNGAWDASLDGNFANNIIFAFHPDSNEEQYHGPSRSAEIKDLQWLDGFTLYKSTSISIALIIVFAIIAGLGALFSIFLIILILLKKDYFRFQTPLFCILIMVGTLLGYLAVFLSFPIPTDLFCTLQVWLLGISYVLVFGCLFAKVYRVYKIATSKKLNGTMVVSEMDVLKPVIGFLLIEVVFLALWTAFDMYKAVEIHVDVAQGEIEIWKVCQSQGVYWWIIFLSIKALFLLLGVFLAVQSRNFPAALNESKQVAFCLYVTLIVVVIFTTLGFALSQFPLVAFLLFAAGICITYIAVSFILNISTLVRIFSGKDPLKVKSVGTTGARSTNATNQSSLLTSTVTSSGSKTHSTDGKVNSASPRPVSVAELPEASVSTSVSESNGSASGSASISQTVTDSGSSIGISKDPSVSSGSVSGSVSGSQNFSSSVSMTGSDSLTGSSVSSE